VKTGSKLRSRLLLGALVAIFAAPPVVSWVLFRYTDIGRDAHARGDLIQPPRLLPDAVLADAAGNPAALHGKWTLVYLASGACDAACMEILYRMRQVRIATGTNSERLQRAVAFASNEMPSLAALGADWPGQFFLADPGFAAAFSLVPGEDPIAAGRLYLVDPRGYLMMSYARDADPAGIIADLKRLLRYSRSG